MSLEDQTLAYIVDPFILLNYNEAYLQTRVNKATTEGFYWVQLPREQLIIPEQNIFLKENDAKQAAREMIEVTIRKIKIDSYHKTNSLRKILLEKL